MRGAGVPARVVTGYLGGEWNPIGDYFVVRQSDAHSWRRFGWTVMAGHVLIRPPSWRRTD